MARENGYRPMYEVKDYQMAYRLNCRTRFMRCDMGDVGVAIMRSEKHSESVENNWSTRCLTFLSVRSRAESTMKVGGRQTP